MTNLEIVASLSLGIIVGWLVRYILRRFKSFGVHTIVAIIGIIVAGGAVEFLGDQRDMVYFYIIGVLLGFLVYTVTVFLWDRWRQPVYRTPGASQEETSGEEKRSA